MIAAHKAIRQINGLRHADKKIQSRARVTRFEELLREQIKDVIGIRVPRTEEVWQKVFTKLRTWFLEVQEGVDDSMTDAALHQHWYLIKEEITNEKEKQGI